MLINVRKSFKLPAVQLVCVSLANYPNSIQLPAGCGLTPPPLWRDSNGAEQICLSE